MKAKDSKPESRKSRLRYLSALSIVLSGFLLFLGNLGCDLLRLSEFKIVLEPNAILAAPGKNAGTDATLYWSGERPIEALSWEILPGYPSILESVGNSPKTLTDSTFVELKFSEDAGLPDSGAFVPAANQRQLLGIKARFVDPVWKSISEGDEAAVLARKAYLQIISGETRFRIAIKDHLPSPYERTTIFVAEVINPDEGSSYTYELSGRLAWVNLATAMVPLETKPIETVNAALLRSSIEFSHGDADFSRATIKIVARRSGKGSKVVAQQSYPFRW